MKSRDPVAHRRRIQDAGDEVRQCGRRPGEMQSVGTAGIRQRDQRRVVPRLGNSAAASSISSRKPSAETTVNTAATDTPKSKPL